MQQNTLEPERWCRICNRSKDIGAFSLHTGKGRYICDDCREPHRKAMRRKHSKAAYDTIKLAVFAAYGCECVYCGERDFDQLSIDHMDGNGKAWREETGREGPMFWYWLRDQGYPSGFQTLCIRCNLAKGNFSDTEFRAWVATVCTRLFS